MVMAALVNVLTGGAVQQHCAAGELGAVVRPLLEAEPALAPGAKSVVER